MTNFVHALAVLEAARRPGEIRIHPHDAVEALAKAGLIMPNLPEPSPGSDGALIWHNGEVWLEDNDTDVYTDLHSPFDWMTTDQARNLAHALLAAADYAEEA